MEKYVEKIFLEKVAFCCIISFYNKRIEEIFVKLIYLLEFINAKELF